MKDQGEISAVQSMMNLRHDNEDAFMAQYQNSPKKPGEEGVSLTVAEVTGRLTGRARGEVPLTCTHLTAMVDVHKELLFWCVVGWQDDFTGFIVDYETFPGQSERYFTVANCQRTLSRAYPGMGEDGAIQAGLTELVSRLLAQNWPRTGGGGVLRIERLLVDMGYKPGIVAAVKHKAGGTAMMLYKGVGIRAGNKPMSTYVKKPGERHGFHWYMPSMHGTSEFPHVASDVNFWKTFLHGRFKTAAGDPGALTTFGSEQREHELFAEHVAASEFWTLTHGHGRDVQEWKQLPSRPDNHWLDCLAGCCAAASMLGAAIPGMTPASKGIITGPVKSWAQVKAEREQPAAVHRVAYIQRVN